MSQRFPGGIVSSNPPAPSSSSASGIWTLKQALEYIQAGTWPGLGDPDFEYVTMLLPGNGTNGAQNNTFLDGSTNNFTITRNGNTTQGTFSPYGDNWSNYFDGSGDFLGLGAVSASGPLDLSTATFTVEAWVFVASTGGQQDVVSSTSANIIANSTVDWVLRINSTGTVTFDTVNGSTVTGVTSSVTITFNAWNHIAVTRNGSSATVYVNGVGKSGSVASTTNTNLNINIGQLGSTGYGNYISGYISNLRIVKGSQVYTSAFTPSTTPLTAITNTSLLTCQSNRFRDASSNNFAITVNGNTSVQRFSPFAPTAPYSAATIGGSAYLDGNGDYLSGSNNSASFGTGDFTIELWLYKNTTATQRIVGGVNSGSESFQLYIFNNNELSFFDGSGVLSASPSNLVPNAWNHIAVTRSSSTLRLYCNGTQATSASNTRNIVSDTVRVGAGGAAITETVNGYICDARILKGTAQYTGSTYTVPTAPLTAITNTSLLLNFTNAGIIDNAMMNDLETVGNAQISTSVSKWGGGSMSFDGTGDYLLVPSSINASFGTGDFTIEFWFNRNAAGSTLVSVQNSSTTGVLIWNSTGLGVAIGNSNVLTNVGSLSNGVWYHIALTRSGTSLRLFQDGVQVGTTVTNSTNFTDTTVRVGANFSNADNFNGYIDDLRITRGVARYTGNFTPPGAPFPTK